MWRVGSAAKSDYVAVRVETGLEVKHIRWRDAGPGQVFLQGPLHAHGFAGNLGEDHGVGFGAIAAKSGAPVLTRVVQPADDNLLRRYAERVGDLCAEALGLSRMGPDGHGAIGAYVGDSEEGTDGSV